MVIGMKTGDTHLAGHRTSSEGRIARWLDLQTASISARYHFIENSGGAIAADNNQYQVVFKGRFKFDANGRYSINAGVLPGSSFSGGWNASGWGTGRGQTNLFLKQLYFNAEPAAGVELQYGGLYILHGESTEITGYDYDGYLTGQRVSLKRPQNLYFDEISFTSGFLGDFRTPNVNKRFRRLRQVNYHQLLLAKKINERISASADYTFESGSDTFRQAVKIKVHEARVVDTVQLENYQRASEAAGYGFGVYAEKRLHMRFTAGGGYAQIDGPIRNSDRFPQGKRMHLNLHVAISPEFSLTIGATQAVGRSVSGLPRTRLDIAINYNLLQSLRRSGLF